MATQDVRGDESPPRAERGKGRGVNAGGAREYVGGIFRHGPVFAAPTAFGDNGVRADGPLTVKTVIGAGASILPHARGAQKRHAMAHPEGARSDEAFLRQLRERVHY
jgi:hypothetical protein